MKLLAAIILGALSILAGLGTVLAAEVPNPKAPNIVFILADDLGWSDTTLYGTTKFYQTPNIERLAQRGMVFTDAYAANPLCSPTRASILTGLYPARIGITTPDCHLPVVRLTEKMVAKAPAYEPALQLINPHFPALRSDPSAVSGASRQKQIPSSHSRPDTDLQVVVSAKPD